MGGSFYFLPLIYDEVGCLRGLVIQPTRSQRGEYERVGMFFLEVHTDRKFEVLDKIANNLSYSTGPEDFAEIRTDTDGKVNRIITLV
jgi:hypothetical protein